MILLLLFLQLGAPSLPNWITIAPGIQAQPNLKIGDEAYKKCLANPNSDTIVCQSARSTAIQNDIQLRFISFFHDLGEGHITDAHSLDVYLSYYQMRLTPASPIIPAPNPFPGN